MPEIGQTISHYKITEKLGQGGMGEVFLAHDTSLDRKVALKFLPDIFSGHPERLARFEREAKLLASLNHPHIATIYGLEQADGKRFLAMELVEGETLALQIERGPLQVDEALDVCRQIAEGVEAAHEKGVIHRDLKPANVKITPEGKVKVLDFGLAKAFQGETPGADASKSPTLTDQMTRPGVILGTAAYMSPEQAKGKAVDKRTDIWAFGCLLYECLTGKRAFHGETVTETVAAILKSEPDWTLVPAETSSSVRAVLRRCLQKDPSLRLRDIGDARMEMQDATPGGSEFHLVSASTPGRWRLFPWIVALLSLSVAIALAIKSVRQPERTPAPVRRFVISLPEPLSDHWRPNLALSPDGTQLAYGAGFGRVNARLYHRNLNELEFKPIPGTEGGQNPFFSPDGKWLGFFTEGRLKKVPVAGGPVVNLAEIGDAWAAGGIWETDESILFQRGRSGGIARINAFATGTMPQTLFTRDRQGRLISCEHDTRRVTRTELDGAITVLVDRYQGKRLNAPNDVVVHSNGGIWFTDPGYGILADYEGHLDSFELPANVYRLDPESREATVVADDFARPNGLCFSPGEKRLYIVDTGQPAGTAQPIRVFDVAGGKRLANGRLFCDMAIGNGSDGIRCDVDGNVWAASDDGVYVIAPDGRPIGRVRLPEICANLCFGGIKRNRLFMTASQSLYALYVNTKGAQLLQA